MNQCIFCLSELTSNTKPEHILQDALGGRKTTKQLICSDCNNKFGREIDNVIADDAALFRNMLQLRSGTGGLPPLVKKLKSVKGLVDLQNDGSPRLNQKPFVVAQSGNDQSTLSINLDSLEQLERLTPHIARAAKTSEDKIRDILSTTPAYIVEQRTGTLQVELTLGSPGALRAMAKSCFMLWADKIGNLDAHSGIYIKIKDYILIGNQAELYSSDYRLHPQNNDIVKDFTPCFNMIYCRSNANGRAIGRFTFYNLVSHTFVLAEHGAPKNLSAAMVVNPVTRHWTEAADTLYPLSDEWLDSPASEFSADFIQRQVGSLMAYYYSVKGPKEAERILQDEWNSLNLPHGTNPTGEQVSSLFRRAGERLACYILNKPYSKQIDPKVMQNFKRQK